MPFFQRPKSSPLKLGQTAERRACQHLKQAGLTIIETNYRTTRGEIDIIAKEAESYIFVEVRMRGFSAFGNAADSIAQRKQRRVIRAATHYLQKNNLWEKIPCRFDTICIDQLTRNGNYQLEWTPNAFWYKE